MLIIAGILFICGFFFPPAWLALIGIGIYLFASRKSRRADEIEGRIKRMISAGKNYVHFSDLYFEAARAYAIEKGATAADNQSASASVVVNGNTYHVVFSRGVNGGTGMGVRDQKEVERELKKYFTNSGIKN